MANNDITVTLANGEVITILAGSSFGTTTTPIQGDDVYIDGETITNSIVSAVEANAGTPGSLESLQLAAGHQREHCDRRHGRPGDGNAYNLNYSNQ